MGCSVDSEPAFQKAHGLCSPFRQLFLRQFFLLLQFGDLKSKVGLVHEFLLRKVIVPILGS